ncbi:PREDICTED: pentatricopeptide repeat-containing protein At1g71460, chloroplastic [Tarenaya hassleriana]|uniref:pentatricopeptide repeat-containing protein At1g71460, chloroplastic n=1 Tax=Tarenaya hassleriana TaxID=28532 RepID=UPI00053C4941|nr:PREDICTED: pentatricopeptide repeat-containing protein At1g71460, chloroplastic [Tarenaya hassleriana]
MEVVSPLGCHDLRPLPASTSLTHGAHIRSRLPPPERPTRGPSRFPAKKPKPFRERDAFPSSLPLHSKNPHRIYRDIQRFARQNKLEDALTILDYLDHRGIPVNATTFSALIAACVRRKSLPHGKQVHVHIRINGLERNDFLRTKLVHMYTACGSLEDAQKVFVESTSSSVYSWNALLRGTVISGKRRYNDVLSTFTEMRELGIDLNVYTFSNVFKSFAGASALRQGLKTHALVIKNGLLESSFLKTCLIDLYFKCGKVRLARKVFDEVKERDIVVWGAMIAGFSHNKRQREALEFFRRMVREEGIYPNSAVITMILPVLGNIEAQKLGKEVHAHALKFRSYMEQPFIHAGLIDFYCKCGDMVSARRVFYGSKQRNAISWTALMSGYASNGRLDQALRSVVWMQQEGFRPDVVTIATVLPVCAELKALKQGKEIHAYALKKLFLPNVSVVTSLMVMYSKCGVLDYPVRLFNGLEQRNVKVWTAMIDSYVENGHLSAGLEVFRSMQLSKHRPDSVAMARVLTVCSELKVLKLGKEIHGQILKKDFESIPFVSARIIKLYGLCGDLKSASFAFGAVPVKGSMTWTAIVEAYGWNGQFRDGINLFQKMMSEGFTPNAFTFTTVLSICCQAGFVDEALRFLSLMLQKYGLQPSKEQYSVVVELLNRFGRVEEAQRLAMMNT